MALGVPQPVLACSCPALTWASVCTCTPTCPLLSREDTPHLFNELLLMNWLQNSRFQISLHPKIPGGCEFGGHYATW